MNSAFQNVIVLYNYIIQIDHLFISYFKKLYCTGWP